MITDTCPNLDCTLCGIEVDPNEIICNSCNEELMDARAEDEKRYHQYPHPFANGGIDPEFRPTSEPGSIFDAID